MTGVYANDLEIACKASDGKSVASFPDPCFSPPAPSAGWIVVPYANTAFAKDATNGSKTVFIGGKPVMLKDRSFIKTSTGNEAAAGPKGVATGTKKGKAYFRSWSMNVKVEGLNVCRHTDLMTHNHNPVNGNTGAWSYLSESTQSKCKDEIKRVNNACDVDDKEQKKFIDRQEERNEKRKKRGKSNKTVRPKTWKDNHCMGLLFYPDPNALQNKLLNVEKDAKELYEDLSGEIWSAAGDIAAETAVNYGERVLIKHGTATVVGAVGAVSGPGVLLTEGAAHLVAVIIDVIDAAVSLVSTAVSIYGAWDNISEIKKIAIEIPSQIEELEKIKNNPEEKEKLRNKLVDKAREAAENDKCLASRKCMLVPYKKPQQKGKNGETLQTVQGIKETAKGGKDSDLLGKLGMGDSRGCCPGQTGHHLIPGMWAETGCKGYINEDFNPAHQKAPVVCIEGMGHSEGSHGSIHKNLNNELEKNNKSRKDRGVESDEYTKAETIEMAVQSHHETYTGTGCTWCILDNPCSEECLRAQLEAAYEACKGPFQLKPVPIKKDAAENDGSDME